MWEIFLDDEKIIYTTSDSTDNDIHFVKYNLQSGKKEVFYELRIDFNGMSFTDEDHLIIVEEKLLNGEMNNIVSVYDLDTLEKKAVFTNNFRSLEQFKVVEDDLYMLYINEDYKKIGHYNFKNGEFTQLKIGTDVSEFATDGQTFLIADRNNQEIKLYERHGNELKVTDTLSSIKERTVRPRIEGDTFIMNGEGSGRPLYVITKQ